MIVERSQLGLYSITLQGEYTYNAEALVYTLSKTMLRVKRTSPAVSIAHVELDDGVEQKAWDFYTDPDGAVEVSLKNFINSSYYKRELFQFSLLVSLNNLDGTDVDGQIVLICNTRAGVSPYELRVPQSPYPQSSIPIVSPFMQMFPPTVMYMQRYSGVNAPDQLMSGVVVESTMYEDYAGKWAWGLNGNYTPISEQGDRSAEVLVNSSADTLKFESVTANYEWTFKVLDFSQCQDAVVIRWVSMTGAIRQHWFPVVGYVNDTDKSMSLLSVGDGYNVRKNPTLALRCRITGLTAYDCWYYQDLLQASDVHAICRSTWPYSPPFLTAIQSTLTQCLIEGGMPQTPEGNGFYNFEFTIKFKHYDAI